MTEEFHRIRRLPPYVFAEVNATKAKARAAGEDIIDLGMGNPDSPTPPHIVAKLIEAVQDPAHPSLFHVEGHSRPAPGARRLLRPPLRREAEPESEVGRRRSGSKEGLANLAQAISSPGDIILVPNPSYPIHPFGFIIAGASVRSLPCTPDDEMLAALDRAVRHSVPKPTAVDPELSRPTRRRRSPASNSTVTRGVLPAARHLTSCQRSRLCRDLFRQHAAAVGPGGARRQGDRRRVHLAEQDLFHARLAHGLRRRQRAADRRR